MLDCGRGREEPDLDNKLLAHSSLERHSPHLELLRLSGFSIDLSTYIFVGIIYKYFTHPQFRFWWSEEYSATLSEGLEARCDTLQQVSLII